MAAHFKIGDSHRRSVSYHDLIYRKMCMLSSISLSFILLWNQIISNLGSSSRLDLLIRDPLAIGKGFSQSWKTDTLLRMMRVNRFLSKSRCRPLLTNTLWCHWFFLLTYKIWKSSMTYLFAAVIIHWYMLQSHPRTPLCIDCICHEITHTGDATTELVTFSHPRRWPHTNISAHHLKTSNVTQTKIPIQRTNIPMN